ncbi:MAG: hypothetical protein ACREJC_22475 [Tepidisphaeraceae bacterium]
MTLVHNALIAFPELARAYKRAVGSDWEVAVERLSETVVPTLDLWSQPEWRHLIAIRSWHTRRSDAAVAAQTSGVGIQNVAGSRSIVVITRCSTDTGNTQLFQGLATATIDASSNCHPRDSRIQLFPDAGVAIPRVVDVTTANLGAAGYFGPTFSVVAGVEGAEIINRDNPVVLAPNSILLVVRSPVATAITAGFAGYTRRALPGELE